MLLEQEICGSGLHPPFLWADLSPLQTGNIEVGRFLLLFLINLEAMIGF